jgi:hypothetical protein
MRGDSVFILAESSDEDAPSLAVDRDDEGRVVISVLNAGKWAAIRLSDEQVAALRKALEEV